MDSSLVSAVMLAGIGPVKPFVAKTLIAHSEGPLRSRSKACAASAASPAARWGRT